MNSGIWGHSSHNWPWKVWVRHSTDPWRPLKPSFALGTRHSTRHHSVWHVCDTKKQRGGPSQPWCLGEILVTSWCCAGCWVCHLPEELREGSLLLVPLDDPPMAFPSRQTTHAPSLLVLAGPCLFGRHRCSIALEMPVKAYSAVLMRIRKRNDKCIFACVWIPEFAKCMFFSCFFSISTICFLQR